MEKEYLVACGAGERPALLAAAELVNRRMGELQKAGRVIGPDRIAVTVALNLANELLEQQRREAKLQSAVERVRSLRLCVEAALSTGMTIKTETGLEDLEAALAGATLPISGHTPP
jgi:cell division protein ZapA